MRGLRIAPERYGTSALMLNEVKHTIPSAFHSILIIIAVGEKVEILLKQCICCWKSWSDCTFVRRGSFYQREGKEVWKQASGMGRCKCDTNLISWNWWGRFRYSYTFLNRYYVLGLFAPTLMWYDKLLTSPSYALVHRHREEWQEQRKQLTRRHDNGMHKVHIFTAASDPTDELTNLLRSAHVAGVQVNVRPFPSCFLCPHLQLM